MVEPSGTPVPFGARLTRGSQLVSVAPPAVESGPPTCAGCGQAALLTGAGSTGFPGLPQAASPRAATAHAPPPTGSAPAGPPARTVCPRLLTGTPSVAPGSPW